MKSLTDLANGLPDYDPGNLSVSTATAYLARLVAPVADCETVALSDALGRVLAEPLIAPRAVPPHDNAAMDGYAFDGAALTPGVPLTLAVGATALAGANPGAQAGAGQCVRIMTGAVMPAGLDTVVPQELTEPASPGHIRIPADALRRGDNRRLRGEDLAEGGVALPAGTRLLPAACGLVASLGLARVSVRRRLRVAYLSTGNEVQSVGEPAREGAIYDSNRHSLCGLLRRLGCEVSELGVVRDDPAALKRAFTAAADGHDAVLTSGGVSVGEADFTRAVLGELGEVLFWRIAMRPGRPLAVGRIGSALLLGLPGNPVAAMVAFLVFARPTLLRLMGAHPEPLPLLRARSLQRLRKRPGRTEYQRGIVLRDAGGNLNVRTTGAQGSGLLSSMVQANGLIVLPHDQGEVAEGDPVDVLMFEGVM